MLAHINREVTSEGEFLLVYLLHKLKPLYYSIKPSIGDWKMVTINKQCSRVGANLFDPFYCKLATKIGVELSFYKISSLLDFNISSKENQIKESNKSSVQYTEANISPKIEPDVEFPVIPDGTIE
jgi:hypothetical protein